MINFEYARPADVGDAVRQMAAEPGAKFIAGGTNLLDLMKEDVERPTKLIDITRLPLKEVTQTRDGGLRIGALVPNSDLAWHPLVEKRYPILSSAILAAATAWVAEHPAMSASDDGPETPEAEPGGSEIQPNHLER